MVAYWYSAKRGGERVWFHKFVYFYLLRFHSGNTADHDADLASAIVWFDAYVTNVDRTPRNTNMLMWHHQLWLIDHGAALYFHHTPGSYLERSRDFFL